MNSPTTFILETGSLEASMLLVLLYLKKCNVIKTKNSLLLVPAATPLSLIQGIRKHCFVTLNRNLPFVAELTSAHEIQVSGKIFAKISDHVLQTQDRTFFEFAKKLQGERDSFFARFFLSLAEWTGHPILLEMAHAPADIALKKRRGRRS